MLIQLDHVEIVENNLSSNPQMLQHSSMHHMLQNFLPEISLLINISKT